MLANISTRGFVQGNESVMIGGFSLGGNSNNTNRSPRTGPLPESVRAEPGAGGSDFAIARPNGALLIENDNWTDDAASAALLTANGLALSDPKESGIFTSMPPGQFTAILAGKNGGIGIGLIEIYNLQ